MSFSHKNHVNTFISCGYSIEAVSILMFRNWLHLFHLTVILIFLYLEKRDKWKLFSVAIKIMLSTELVLNLEHFLKIYN